MLQLLHNYYCKIDSGIRDVFQIAKSLMTKSDEQLDRQDKVKTKVLDVLPDGTITELILSVDNVIAITFARKAPNENFIIKRTDILSNDVLSVENA